MSQSRFNALFVQQRLPLLRTLQRMVGNPSTAEDLLQETYLRVARALAERPVTHLEPFVFQTARNLALDHLRARRAQARTLVDDVPEQVLHNVAAPLGSSEDAAHAEQLLKHLSSYLGQLTERQQRIFVLSRVQGASYLEIARQLKVSASTVQKELKLIMALCMDIARRLS
ncbi:sigma-70 family RNA polymerase sigma factor [Pseudomonas sp.]|uniref:RNA polymerase sigma factor n=1 Tax=Pseudomonas sp. TaxID=306 RepID=UPI0028A82B65|nr:sigma-70 family RNA polymerase sigma factor [Pseudomonas sp.]